MSNSTLVGVLLAVLVAFAVGASAGYVVAIARVESGPTAYQAADICLESLRAN